MIMVKCQHGDHWFPSRLIQADEESYKTMTLSGNFEPCMLCGKETEVSNATTKFLKQ